MRNPNPNPATIHICEDRSASKQNRASRANSLLLNQICCHIHFTIFPDCVFEGFVREFCTQSCTGENATRLTSNYAGARAQLSNPIRNPDTKVFASTSKSPEAHEDPGHLRNRCSTLSIAIPSPVRWKFVDFNLTCLYIIYNAKSLHRSSN